MKAKILSFVFALLGIFSITAKSNIDVINPPYWWIGMECDTLQVMIAGKDIANATVTMGNIKELS